MDLRKETPDYAADASPGNRSEHLRTLKRGNEKRAAQPAAAAPPPGMPAASSAAAAAPSADKRRRPRYRCEGSAEFRTEGVDMRTWATLTDMSMSGCYVELPATSAINTAVNMVLDVKGLRVRLKGVVRTSYPLLGMGIEFTEVSSQEKPRLEELLRRLAGETEPPFELEPIPTGPVVPDVLMIMDAGAALKAVAMFFQNNQSLTQDQFKKLIGKSQDRDRAERR